METFHWKGGGAIGVAVMVVANCIDGIASLVFVGAVDLLAIVVVPVAMAPVTMSWIVVAIDVGDDSIVVIVPVSVTPVAVAGVVVAIDVAHEDAIIVVPVA